MDVVDAVCSGHSMQWTQYAVDAVHSGHSGIVVYGGGDIVFGAKRSNQWMQWTMSHSTQYCSGHSMQWTQYAVDAVRRGCSGIVVYGGGDIVFGAKRSNQWMQWIQYAVDAVCSECSTQWMQWNSGIWWWGHCLWC